MEPVPVKPAAAGKSEALDYWHERMRICCQMMLHRTEAWRPVATKLSELELEPSRQDARACCRDSCRHDRKRAC